MKYRLKIETEWPDIANKRGGFTYVDLFDWSLTPKVREHFFLDNGVVYEHRIMGNDSNLLVMIYRQIVPDNFVMQFHRF